MLRAASHSVVRCDTDERGLLGSKHQGSVVPGAGAGRPASVSGPAARREVLVVEVIRASLSARLPAYAAVREHWSLSALVPARVHAPLTLLGVIASHLSHVTGRGPVPMIAAYHTHVPPPVAEYGMADALAC